MSGPVWGICRHGLVTGGQLALPNGGTFPYSQPLGAGPGSTIWPDTYGKTLIATATDETTITRTPEEAADDYAKGYVWQTVSVLSGAASRLAQRAMTLSWIYRAPDKSVWQATVMGVSQTTAYDIRNPRSFSIRLRRFGVLNRAAESYTYPLSLPNLGFDDATWIDTYSVYLAVETCSRFGNKAALSAMPSSATNRRQLYSVHEFQITGTPGIDAAVTVSKVYGASAIASVVAEGNGHAEGNFVGWRPIGGGEWQWMSEPLPWPGMFDYPWERPGYSTKTSTSQSGTQIVGVFYDAADSLIPVEWVVEIDSTFSRPLYIDPVRTANMTTTTTSCLRAGGVSGPVYTETVTTTQTQDWSVRADGMKNEQTESITYNFGSGLGRYRTDDTALSSIPVLPALMGLGRVGYGPFNLCRYANYAVGLYASAHKPGVAGGVTVAIPPFTPSGPAAGAPFEVPSSTLYGSHNPATGETTWGSTVPVCYV